MTPECVAGRARTVCHSEDSNVLARTVGKKNPGARNAESGERLRPEGWLRRLASTNFRNGASWNNRAFSATRVFGSALSRDDSTSPRDEGAPRISAPTRPRNSEGSLVAALVELATLAQNDRVFNVAPFGFQRVNASKLVGND